MQDCSIPSIVRGHFAQGGWWDLIYAAHSFECAAFLFQKRRLPMGGTGADWRYWNYCWEGLQVITQFAPNQRLDCRLGTE